MEGRFENRHVHIMFEYSFIIVILPRFAYSLSKHHKAASLFCIIVVKN